VKPECERYEAIVDAGGPADQSAADFATTHLAGCPECRVLEGALAAVALRAGDADHFPLDELARRRTVDAVLREARELQVEQQQPTRPRRWATLALAVAAGLALIIGAPLLLRQSQTQAPTPAPAIASAPKSDAPKVTPPAPVAPMLAQVRLVAGRDERSPGLEIAEGTPIQTRAATLGLTVTDHAWVRALPGAEFTFLSLRRNEISIELRSGHLDVQVPRGRGIDLQVRTPHGLVKVIGTAFSLNATRAKTRLAVAEGTVLVEAGGRQVRVSSGFALALGAARPSTVSKSELASLKESLAQEKLVGDGSGRLSVTAGRQLSIDSVGLGSAPVKLMVSMGAHSVTRLDGRGRPQRSTAEVVSGRESVVSDRTKTVARADEPQPADPGPRASPSISITPVPVDPPLQTATESAEQLLQQAQKARTQRDWPGAARAYSAIIEHHEMSAAAEVARLSLGQLKVDQLGEPNQGHALCATYIERNPSGALVAEAELCQIRAFASLGEHANELRAIDSFLSRWPTDFNAARLARRKAVLQPPSPQ